ncbi:MAG: NAD(P)/FAD-dependent oxidoreductase [Pseudomonadota bacterium]
MSERVDTVVIGAGAVGLAVARTLASHDHEVIVLEQHRDIGTEVSSRNSEVIHAGIYYPRNSLKAQLCVRGRDLLYPYLTERGVPHERCGKLVVATHRDQHETLREYQRRALDNRAGELQWLNPSEVRAREPEVECTAAVFSPYTGILDSHSYMLALQGDLENAGGVIAFDTTVTQLKAEQGEIVVETLDAKLHARWVINAAGLHAPNLYRQLNPTSSFRCHYAKGHYYSYTGTAPFSGLVYPVAEASGLGVHVTLDLEGNVRFGPDVRWIDHIDYDFDDSQRAEFVDAICRYYPALDVARLTPGYTGIRPKIVGPGEAAADFVIDAESSHGVAGLVNLLGIESPGLTSSLAIGEYVQRLIATQ